MLPAEARRENQERAGDGACSPGISLNARTRIYLNSRLGILTYGFIFQHRAGLAGVDHPNTILLAGGFSETFSETFSTHILVEDLWCFPKFSLGSTSGGNP